MELILVILFTASYSVAIFIAISASLANKELREELRETKSRSVDREELIMKRVYKNLSDKLIEERDYLLKKIGNMRKDLFIYRRLKKKIIRNRK